MRSDVVIEGSSTGDPRRDSWDTHVILSSYMGEYGVSGW